MAKYIDQEKTINAISEAFKGNWEVPCTEEDRLIQTAVCRVYDIIRKQPVLENENTTEKLKLKPCPFCGKSPVINKRSNTIDSGCFRIEYAIGCNNCHTAFKAETHLEVKDGVPCIVQDGYKECIEKWNRRVGCGD